MNKFNRFLKVKIGDADLSGLRITFRVERLAGDSFHKLNLQVFNSENIFPGGSGISSFDLGQTVPIEVDAGYEDSHAIIFDGIVRNVVNHKQGADIISDIFAYDRPSLDIGKMNFTISNPGNVSEVIARLAAEENISIAEMQFNDGNFVGAFVGEKTFRDHINELALRFNFNWYILGSELYIYDHKKGNNKIIHTISVDSGMIDTPELTDIGINVKTLMSAKIKPEHNFDVISQRFSTSQARAPFQPIDRQGLGRNIVTTLNHTGDTHGDLWITEIHGRTAF